MIYEPSDIVNVFEKEKNNGYRQVNSIESVGSFEGSYYYDKEHMNLYIHCYDEVSGDEIIKCTPFDTNVIVETR